MTWIGIPQGRLCRVSLHGGFQIPSPLQPSVGPLRLAFRQSQAKKNASRHKLSNGHWVLGSGPLPDPTLGHTTTTTAHPQQPRPTHSLTPTSGGYCQRRRRSRNSKKPPSPAPASQWPPNSTCAGVTTNIPSYSPYPSRTRPRSTDLEVRNTASQLCARNSSARPRGSPCLQAAKGYYRIGGDSPSLLGLSLPSWRSRTPAKVQDAAPQGWL